MLIWLKLVLNQPLSPPLPQKIKTDPFILCTLTKKENKILPFGLMDRPPLPTPKITKNSQFSTHPAPAEPVRTFHSPSETLKLPKTLLFCELSWCYGLPVPILPFHSINWPQTPKMAKNSWVRTFYSSKSPKPNLILENYLWALMMLWFGGPNFSVPFNQLTSNPSNGRK